MISAYSNEVSFFFKKRETGSREGSYHPVDYLDPALGKMSFASFDQVLLETTLMADDSTTKITLGRSWVTQPNTSKQQQANLWVF
jgi:hypothetical protein